MSNAPAEAVAPQGEKSPTAESNTNYQSKNAESLLLTSAADSEAQEDKKDTAGRGEFDVFWDEPAEQDSANPMNWSMPRKWGIIALVSFITFLT